MTMYFITTNHGSPAIGHKHGHVYLNRFAIEWALSKGLKVVHYGCSSDPDKWGNRAAAVRFVTSNKQEFDLRGSVSLEEWDACLSALKKVR
jgi:hypothetical protein